MNTQTIRTIVIFTIITGVLFFAADNISPDSDLEPQNETSSAQFLDLIAQLDTVSIDFDFVDDLGTSAVVTDIRIDEARPGDIGRNNPFRQTDSGESFSDSRGIVSNLQSFGQGSVPGGSSVIPDVDNSSLAETEIPTPSASQGVISDPPPEVSESITLTR